jgi:hypothetical protein
MVESRDDKREPSYHDILHPPQRNQVIAETGRLKAIVDVVVDGIRARISPELRHYFHIVVGAAAARMLVDSISNIRCRECRQRAVEHALKMIPAMAHSAANAGEAWDAMDELTHGDVAEH